MGLKFRRGTTAQKSGSLAFGEPYVNTTLGTLQIGGATGDITLGASGTGSQGSFAGISGSSLDITGNAKIDGNLTLGGGFIKLGDDALPELDYKFISDAMFKAMYGPGTKTQDLLSQFKKLRNIKDLQKVNTAFGERKGMIGGSHDLNWWIKDELKDKDIEVINTDFKEKGIDYKF